MTQTPENFDHTIKSAKPKIVDSIIKTRETTLPEKEYSLGLLMVGVYLITLYRPELLPTENLQTLAELLHQIPSGESSLLIAIALGGILSIDGATRIALERVPFYKAYLDVFVFKSKKQI